MIKPNAYKGIIDGCRESIHNTKADLDLYLRKWGTFYNLSTDSKPLYDISNLRKEIMNAASLEEVYEILANYE